MSPCVWTVDPGCCTDWSTFSPAVQLAATRFATDVMWALTGRQFGTCPITVRPCGDLCSQGYGVFWDDGTFMPYVFNGTWYNATCNCLGVCACVASCRAWLPGPVAAISQVTVDGVIIPDTAYRVDDDHFLVRESGGCWPTCQNFDVPAGAVGSFVVTYFRGTPVPTSVLGAAGVLACEYAQACVGGTCRLPGRVTSLTRQGVTFTQEPISQTIMLGYTNIPEVDYIIRAYNPFNLPARLRLFSPDMPTATMTTIS